MNYAVAVVLSAIALSSGCATRDARGPSLVCEVHHIAMRSVSVPLVVGWVDHFDANYTQAADHVFPHMQPEGPASKWRRERVYVCDECVRAQRDWLQSHR